MPKKEDAPRVVGVSPVELHRFDEGSRVGESLGGALADRGDIRIDSEYPRFGL